MKSISSQKVSLFCFGNTANGEFGLGGIDALNILSPKKQKSPEINQPHLRIEQLASGRNHTLLVLTANTIVRSNDGNFNESKICVTSRVYSSGSNESQQLGRDGSWKRFNLIEELNKHHVVQIACGYNHNLALTEAGQVFSWGCNLFGQLGTGSTDECCGKPSLIKKLAHEVVVQIVCGGNHSLALTRSGTLYAWGSNAFGQLGIGSAGNCINLPTMVIQLNTVPLKYVCAGGSHSVALTYTSKLYVWGKNDFGQLGTGNTSNRSVPAVLKSLTGQNICFVACGDDHTAALTRDGGLFTWGAGMYGQLGHGRNSNELLPRRVFELMGSEVSQVSCGRCHTLAVVGKKGRLYAFGLNGCGQLGTNSQTCRSLPTKIDGPWVEVDAHEVTLRPTSGPVIELEQNVIKGLINSKLTDNADVASGDGEKNDEPMVVDSPTFEELDALIGDGTSPMKNVGDTISDSPIVEEPEESEERHLQRQDTVEISEYESDPDTDCESDKPDPNHSTHFGGSIPGSLRRKTHLRLFAAVASKGDQSFILTTKLSDSIATLDFRAANFSRIREIDNSMLETMFVIDDDDKIPDEIIEYVENTCGSVPSWNASYIPQQHDNQPPMEPYVDWEAAYYGFNCLRKCINPRLEQISYDVIVQNLIPKLPLICGENGLDAEVLRVFLLLPLYHVFSSEKKEDKVITELISAYSRTVCRLNSSAQKTMEKWWTEGDVVYFQHLLKIYKDCVGVIIRRLNALRTDDQAGRSFTSLNQRSHENLKNCLDFLKVLHDVNQRANLVSYKDFYISEITESVDVKWDYAYWLTARCKSARDISSQKNLYFCDYPFVFDAGAKTLVLATDSAIRQQTAAENAVYGNLTIFPNITTAGVPTIVTHNPYFVISVTRDNLVNCAHNQLLSRRSASEYKKPLKINFEGEEAVDAGAGMKKEFFLLLMKDLLDSKYGKFTEYAETGTIWFNAAETHPEELQMYELIGIVCGLAVYNQVIIYLPFPLPLYKKILKEPLSLDDLSALDPHLTRSLKEIVNTSYTEEEFNAVYGDMNFMISLNCYGCPHEFELCPGGKDRYLNYSCRVEYVDLYWNFILNDSVAVQFKAFQQGFNKVLETDILSLIHSEELMQLVIGDANYDWELLEKEGTSYKEPFNANHPTIKMFWKVFHSLSHDEKKNFLFFLTGSDRIPILGMKALNVIIQPMNVAEDFLPVAHTCFNVLDLPERYSSEEKMRSKILQAIQHTQGFSLA